MALPKLVAFDVDGTLVDFDGVCTDRTRSTLAQLREAGVHTAIATGRPRSSIDETLALTGPVDYAICGNGGTVTEVSTGRTIHQAVLPGPDVVELITAVRGDVANIGVAVELHDDTGLEEPGFDRRIVLRRDGVEPVLDVVAVMGDAAPDVQRVIFFHDDYDRDIFTLAERVDQHLSDRFAMYCGVQLPLVEILPPGQNKGVAVATLAGHLGLDAVDVMAFGDGTNDIEMFEWVGRGIAMGPFCSPELLAVATAVTEPVAGDGVPNYLAQLLA